jgi:hypothetical protein
MLRLIFWGLAFYFVYHIIIFLSKLLFKPEKTDSQVNNNANFKRDPKDIVDVDYEELDTKESKK